MGRNLLARIFWPILALFSTHGNRLEDRSPLPQAAANRGKNRSPPKKLTILTAILKTGSTGASVALRIEQIGSLVADLQPF
jgi:hypothetical protein